MEDLNKKAAEAGQEAELRSDESEGLKLEDISEELSGQDMEKVYGGVRRRPSH